MKIDFENGSSIKTIDIKEESKRPSGVTMTVYPLTLDYVKKYHCTNCMNWCGNNHDYGCKSCEICIERIEWSQFCFL